MANPLDNLANSLINMGDTSGSFNPSDPSQQPIATQGDVGLSGLTSEELAQQSRIPSNVMEKIQNTPTDDVEADINNDSIIGRKESIRERLQRMATPYFNADFGTEKLSREDFFPDIDRGIQAGTYQGSIVGSNPIYVGEGSLFPFAIMANRQVSQHKAAEEKAKKNKEFFDAFQIDAPAQFNKRIQERSQSLLDKYGEVTNYDYSLLQGDGKVAHEFRREKRMLEVLAKDLDAGDKLANAVRLTAEDKTKFVSDRALEAAATIKRGSVNLDELAKGGKARDGYYGAVQTLKAYENMNAVLTTNAQLESNLSPLINGAISSINSSADLRKVFDHMYINGDYNGLISGSKEFVTEAEVRAVVEPILRNTNVYMGQDIEDKKEREKVKAAIVQDAVDIVYGKIGEKIKASVNLLRVSKDDTTNKPDSPKKTSLFGDAWKSSQNKSAEISTQIAPYYTKYAQNPKDLQGFKNGVTSVLNKEVPATWDATSDYVMGSISRGFENQVVKTVDPTKSSTRYEWASTDENGKTVHEFLTTTEYGNRIVNKADAGEEITDEEALFYERHFGAKLFKENKDLTKSRIKDEDFNAEILRNRQVVSKNAFDPTNGSGSVVEAGVSYFKTVNGINVPVTYKEMAAEGKRPSDYKIGGYVKLVPMTGQFPQEGSESGDFGGTARTETGQPFVYTFQIFENAAAVTQFNTLVTQQNVELNREAQAEINEFLNIKSGGTATTTVTKEEDTKETETQTAGEDSNEKKSLTEVMSGT